MISFKLVGEKNFERLLSQAVKRCRKTAELALEDATLFAHETAVERSNRVVLQKLPSPKRGYFDPTPGRRNKLRPFMRTGTYRRSIKFKVANKKLKGTISAGANYSKKLEEDYKNLEQSAVIAMKKFPKFFERNFRSQMRKNRSGRKRA